MNDAAKKFTKQWAEEFIERHGAVTDQSQLRMLIDREVKDGALTRVAMTQLPIDLFAAGLIHHTSKQVAQQKVREVSLLAGQAVTRREYWNKIDRVHHFAAGLIACIDGSRSISERSPDAEVCG